MALHGDDLVRMLAAPRGVAVVGASADPVSPSGRPLDYLVRHGFRGRVVPVNPRHAEIAGLPAARDLRELAGADIDVAVIAVRASRVVAALEDAERIGLRAAVVIGSGFEDRDGEPRRALEHFVAASELRVIGPNCVGSLAVDTSAYLTFSSVLGTETPRTGRIGLVTQSGALGNSLLQTLIRRHVGLAHWISSGDEVDAGAVELATGLLSQDEIDVVGLFLEGITDPEWLPRLEEVLRTGRKRLFVLKAASSSAGRQAAAGHTGRVVGSAAASHAILRELGAREVPTVGALADALLVAETIPALLDHVTPRVSIVSVSGAAGVIGSDRVATTGTLRMATVDDAVAAELADGLDSRLLPANPLDVPFLDETATFAESIGAYASSTVGDLVIAIESGLAHDRVELAAKLVADPGTARVVLTSLSEDDQIPSDVVERLSGAGIAYLPTIERAVDAVAVCVASGPPEASAVAEPAPPTEGLEWVAERVPAGFPWARWQVVDDSADLSTVAVDFGVPLVLKAAGRTIVHRTELDAVRVVTDLSRLEENFRHVRGISARAGDAVLAQEMVPAGFEVMLSALRDPEFGPVVFLRPGGVLAERMSGQAVLWGGWDEARRDRVLRASVLGEILAGYRGGTHYDLAALGALVSSTLDAVADRMSFLEINPVIVRTSGVYVVDAIARP